MSITSYDPDQDYRCCALDEGHSGPCAWRCSDCDGQGDCPICRTDCHCDDVVQCEACDGNHACPAGCNEGWFSEGDR